MPSRERTKEQTKVRVESSRRTRNAPPASTASRGSRDTTRRGAADRPRRRRRDHPRPGRDGSILTPPDHRLEGLGAEVAPPACPSAGQLSRPCIHRRRLQRIGVGLCLLRSDSEHVPVPRRHHSRRSVFRGLAYRQRSGSDWPSVSSGTCCSWAMTLLTSKSVVRSSITNPNHGRIRAPETPR